MLILAYSQGVGARENGSLMVAWSRCRGQTVESRSVWQRSIEPRGLLRAGMRHESIDRGCPSFRFPIGGVSLRNAGVNSADTESDNQARRNADRLFKGHRSRNALLRTEFFTNRMSDGLVVVAVGGASFIVRKGEIHGKSHRDLKANFHLSGKIRAEAEQGPPLAECGLRR